MSRRESRIVVVASMLLVFSPVSVHACNVCARQILYYSFPWLGKVGIVLVIWAASYLTWRMISGPPLSRRRLWGLLLINGVVVAFLGFQALDAGLVVYLLGLFGWCGVGIAWRTVRVALKSRAEGMRIARRFRFPLILSAIALFVTLPLAVAEQVRYQRMDDLERLQAYCLGVGGVVQRSLVTEIARDSDFRVERLRSWLESGNSSMEINAFQILAKRANPRDLVLFRAIVEAHPSFEKVLSERYPKEAFYLSTWLQELGMPESVRTREAFAQWVEQLDKGATATRVSMIAP